MSPSGSYKVMPVRRTSLRAEKHFWLAGMTLEGLPFGRHDSIF